MIAEGREAKVFERREMFQFGLAGRLRLLCGFSAISAFQDFDKTSRKAKY